MVIVGLVFETEKTSVGSIQSSTKPIKDAIKESFESEVAEYITRDTAILAKMIDEGKELESLTMKQLVRTLTKKEAEKLLSLILNVYPSLDSCLAKDLSPKDVDNPNLKKVVEENRKILEF